MPRIGLKALGVDMGPIKDLTIKEIYGSGIVSVPEVTKLWWALIREKELKVQIEVESSKKDKAKKPKTKRKKKR